MFRKILFLFASTAITWGQAWGQAEIKFENTTFDFGNVSEGTQATHDFVFTNTGTEPLIINAVRASCGCTTPHWTKEPVLPGKQGKITASYNSKNRSGAFNKSVTVTSSATQPSSVVFIKGLVVGRENIAKVFTDQEIAASPNLSVDKLVQQLGKVEKGQEVPFTILVKNTGISDLNINSLKSVCNCIILDAKSIKTIKAGKSETLKLVYNAKNLGNRNEVFTVYSNDIINPETKLTLQSVVVESLGNQSILREKSGKVTF